MSFATLNPSYGASSSGAGFDYRAFELFRATAARISVLKAA
jgi:hypothetical protein